MFQVLYYSGLNLAPKTDNNVKYLTVEDLPQMINPIESKLGIKSDYNIL